MLNTKRFILALTIVFLFSAVGVFAQSSAFVYQGKLQDGSAAANGTYQFEFKLFDSASGGNQIGQTLSDIPATVTNGIFSVNLDFGAASYTGAPRFLEISVRMNGSGQPYTLLNPRQQVTSTPYAVKSLNADEALTANNSLNLGGIAANQYVLTTDGRMSDARMPLPGSTNYIQNGTSQQALANFNIAGDGAAKTFNTSEGYKINSTRVLWAMGQRNIFGGAGAGSSNVIGVNNSFFGTEAGFSNTTGGSNSFFGDSSGRSNTSALANSFFGANSGKLTTTGGGNSFFGFNSGFNNTTGTNNSFFGVSAGQFNTDGKNNVFVGYYAGYSNSTGWDNTFVGSEAGKENQTAKYNSFFGARAGYKTISGENNAFFGINAGYNNINGQSNVFLGSNSGYNNTANYNVFVGANSGVNNSTGTQNVFLGTSSGGNNTTGSFNTFSGYQSGLANTTGERNAFFGTYSGSDNTVGNNNAFFGYGSGASNTNGSSNTFAGKDAANQNTTGSYNAFFGTSAGALNTTGLNNVGVGYQAGAANQTGSNNTSVGFMAGDGVFNGSNNTAIGANTTFAFTGLQYATTIGAGSSVTTDNTVVLGRSADTVRIPGKLTLIGLGAAGGTALCRNASNQIANCSSSRRYKQNIENFTGGLNLIDRLRPVTFEWKADGKADVGFVAEEVNAVEPRLSVYDEEGNVEGVKYAQITTVLVNAVKEQQTQIKQQQAENQKLQDQIKQQQAQIDALKALVCAQNANAAVCQK